MSQIASTAGRILTACRGIQAATSRGACHRVSDPAHIGTCRDLLRRGHFIGAARAFEKSVDPGDSAQPRPAGDGAHRRSRGRPPQNQTASIIGPAIGGFSLHCRRRKIPLRHFRACCSLFAANAPRSVSDSWNPGAVRKPETLRTSIFSGIRYIRDHKNILGAISLDLFAVLLGGATALLPAYAHDVLHTGPWGLGLLRLSPAIGALLTSIVIAHYPIRKHAGMRMFCAVMVFGLATIAFALSRSVWLSMGILIVLGSADVMSVVVRSTLVQLETPDHMRGRVSAVNTLFIGTSNQLGEFESGLSASVAGAGPGHNHRRTRKHHGRSCVDAAVSRASQARSPHLKSNLPAQRPNRGQASHGCVTVFTTAQRVEVDARQDREEGHS